MMPVARARARTLALDMIERVLLVATLGWFVIRMLPSIVDTPANVLVVASEGFVVLMVLIRRPGPISPTPVAWIAAVLGTFPPLFVVPAGAPLAPAWTAGALMLAGLLLSATAKLFLNQSFGIVAANRGVKSAGPYRVVRHPMYLGYAITHAGFLLLHPLAFNIAVYAMTWSALVLRIGFEERFLRRDPAYRDYARSVRYRMVPGLF